MSIIDWAGQFLRTDGRLHVHAAGDGYNAAVEITRPANTTAYTAGDVIGIADAGTPANAGSAIFEITNIGPSGGTIFMNGVSLRVDVNAIPSGMTSFRWHIFNASPTAILDNAAWDLVANDRSKYLGYIDVGTIADFGSTLYVQSDQIAKQFKLATGSTSLWGVLMTNGGYTPSSSAVKHAEFHASAV